MNKKLVLRVASRIQDEVVSEYDQTRWADGCGTPLCIAGHAVVEAGGELVANRVSDGSLLFDQARYGGDLMDIEDAAALALDIDENDAGDLFSPCPFEDDDKHYAPTREDAVATLRHFAQTGDVDWYKGRE